MKNKEKDKLTVNKQIQEASRFTLIDSYGHDVTKKLPEGKSPNFIFFLSLDAY